MEDQAIDLTVVECCVEYRDSKSNMNSNRKKIAKTKKQLAIEKAILLFYIAIAI